MTPAEYTKVAKEIREQSAAMEPGGTAHAALRAVAEVIADIYAGTTRFPDKGRAQFLALAGF